MFQTIKGELKHGFIIGGETYKRFELKEATTRDLLATEADSSIDKPLNFDAALLCRQLTIEGFDGAVAPAMIGKLKVADFNILRQKQRELERLGESDENASEPG
jgi:phage FluMu protein gp41